MKQNNLNRNVDLVKLETKGNNAFGQNNKRIAMRVSMVSILVNLGLSLLKLIAGIIGHSGAMISDAVHSASDVFSTFIVMIGVSISEKQSDKEHPYGHERLECVASILLAVVLALTGLIIGQSGIGKIMAGNYGHLVVPGLLALIAALASIAVKEWMFWYTRAASIKINSGALMADAWHHRSDSLSSVGAFAGILGARMGYPILDPIASIVICLFILKAAVEIFIDAVNKMVDKACPDSVVEEMEQVILGCEKVAAIDELKTRLFGAKIYVEVEIAVDATLTLQSAHDIAEEVHDLIEEHFEAVKHCTVHVNPHIS